MNSLRRSIILVFATVILAAFSIPVFFFLEHRFYYARLEKYLTAHSITEDISITCGSSKIGLNPGPDPQLCYACIPSEMTRAGKMDISFAHIKSVSIGDGAAIRSGDPIREDAIKASEEPVPFRIYAIGGEVLYDGYIRFLFAKDIPSVYISASENALPAVDATPDDAVEKYHADITVTLIDTDGSVDTVADGEIFRHGNTSFEYFDLKPYNINFDSVQTPLGMSPSRKWVLKSNGQYETVLLKNEAAFETGRIMGSVPVPDSSFVNLYVNGVYKGFYSLCQRISVPDMPALSDVSALYERDFKYKTREHGFKYKGKGISILYPEKLSEEEATLLEERFLAAAEEIAGDGPLDMLDTDSFISMYILQDLFVQTDIDNDSFYVMQKNDGKFYAGPLWDFDCSMGHITTGPYHEDLSIRARLLEDHGIVFLHDLGAKMSHRDGVSGSFSGELSKKLHEYVNGKLAEDIERTESSRAMSALVNDMKPTGKGTDDDPEKMLDFMKKRLRYLDAYYASPDDYIPVTYHFAWGNMTIGVKKGFEIGPMPNEGAEDSEDFWGEVTGFVTLEGKNVDGSFVPDGPTDIYTVYEDGSYAWSEYTIPAEYLGPPGQGARNKNDASGQAADKDSVAEVP